MGCRDSHYEQHEIDYGLAPLVACVLADAISGSEDGFRRAIRKLKINWTETGTTPDDVIDWVERHRKKDALRREFEKRKKREEDASQRELFRRLKKFGG